LAVRFNKFITLVGYTFKRFKLSFVFGYTNNFFTTWSLKIAYTVITARRCVSVVYVVALAVRPSIRPSQADVLSKSLNMLSCKK